MFNLLPESEKKALWKEYSLRRKVMYLIFLAILGAAMFIVAIPSLQLSLAKEREVEQRIEAVKRSTIAAEGDTLNQTLTNESLKIKALEPQGGGSFVYELVELIISHKGEEIKLRNISYRKTLDDSEEIIIAGRATDREALLDFREKLEGEGNFESTELPVSSFAKENNLDFTMTITIKAK